MPYNREVAGKSGHSEFVRNPDVQSFLSNCSYLKEPTDQEAKEIASHFVNAPKGTQLLLPRYVVASDASKSDAPINDKLPSTQIGFLKISHVLVDTAKYSELINPETRFVDPFKVAEMHRNASSGTFTMPGSNIRYRGMASVRDGFRCALFDQMSTDHTETQNGFTLVNALLGLNQGSLTIEKCPVCRQSINIQFDITSVIATCPICAADVFVTDDMRLHEGISDFGDNAGAMTRMMNSIEHLMLASFIQQIFSSHPQALSNIAFVVDGPLAIFGQPAKLHKRIQKLIYLVNKRLCEMGANPLLVMGLQKTGGLMDHAKLLERFLPCGVLRVVDDEYRNSFITGRDTPSSNFGDETYYGQDFLFKTERGSIFNFAIAYPFHDKTDVGAIPFARAKTDLHYYERQLERACDLIRHFEMDLYDNALVPVALAHRHASISLVPGGKILDLLARSGLQNEL
jgi:hypothetical protein